MYCRLNAGEDRRWGFTLIELLIVVLIIAVLAAIALPNFLEFQTRAKVSRVKAEMRMLSTGIEAYRVEQGEYPEGTDNPAKYPQAMADVLGPLAKGYYTFRTRGPGGEQVGRDFFGLTTPIAYVSRIPGDPFVASKGPFTYCYRNAKQKLNGWILTSVGPDGDLLAPGGVGNANAQNPLSTAADGNSPARLGDINEREVIHFYEGGPTSASADPALFIDYLADLSYDPTNGTTSDGDIFRVRQ